MSFRIKSSHHLVNEGSKQNNKDSKPSKKEEYSSSTRTQSAKTKVIKSGLRVKTTTTSQADFY